MGVHEGHAFIVEAAVSVGGKNIKPGLNIHRFANRIPLLFEVCGVLGCAWSSDHAAHPFAAWRVPNMHGQCCRIFTPLSMHPQPQGGSDVVTRTALKRVNWSSYKINQNSDKVAFS